MVDIIIVYMAFGVGDDKCWSGMCLEQILPLFLPEKYQG